MNNQITQYTFIINGRGAHLNDPTPTPHQLLVEAGYEPAEDYVLIALAEHGTKVLSADETLDLQGAQAEFFAFEGGATFEATVNSHSVWWGAEKIDITTLRRLGRVKEDEDLVWVNIEGQNEVLPLHGEFALSGKGIEHLKTKARPQPVEYHFFVDGTKYTTTQPELTGAQIMAMIADWNPENSLVLESEGNDPDEVIRPTTVVSFKDRHGVAHFSVVPPATFGAV